MPIGRQEKIKDWIIVERLADIILANVEGCVVDIGIGASTQLLVDYSRKAGVRHLSCDVQRKRCMWAREKLGVEAYMMPSLEFIEQFPDIPVALVFIDGKHLHEVTIKEVRFFLKKMSPGGVIFLHDTYPLEKDVDESGQTCGTMYKTRQMMERDTSVWTFTWPYTAVGHGLTMIMKKERREKLPYCRW